MTRQPLYLLILVAFCFCTLLAQTPATSPPAPPAFKPPPPHVNAPLGDIPAMPGDGQGNWCNEVTSALHPVGPPKE